MVSGFQGQCWPMAARAKIRTPNRWSRSLRFVISSVYGVMWIQEKLHAFRSLVDPTNTLVPLLEWCRKKEQISIGGPAGSPVFLLECLGGKAPFSIRTWAHPQLMEMGPVWRKRWAKSVPLAIPHPEWVEPTPCSAHTVHDMWPPKYISISALLFMGPSGRKMLESADCQSQELAGFTGFRFFQRTKMIQNPTFLD